MKRIFISTLVIIVGILLIITGFIHFWPQKADSTLLIVDIVVTIIAWSLMTFDLFHPLMDINKQQPRQTGSLGVRWFATYGYFVVVVTIMLIGGCVNPRISPFGQTMLQAVVLLLLVIVLVSAFHAGDKVEELAHQEKQLISRKDRMKQVIQQIQDTVACSADIPIEIKKRLKDLEENIRYITPTEKLEAVELEEEFCNLADSINEKFARWDINSDSIEQVLQKMERTLNNRKQIWN